MTELYDTVYPPRIADCRRIPVWWYLSVCWGAENRKIIFYGAACLPCGNRDLYYGAYPVRKGTVLYLALEDDYARLAAAAITDVWCGMCSDNFYFATQAKSLE